MVRPFEKLLDAHNPDDVQRLIDEQGSNAAPCQRIECGDWSLKGWLRPIPLGQRRNDSTRPLILGDHRAKWTNSVIPIQEALKEKVRKYRKLDAPLVVAVNARDMFYNGRENDMEVLFGRDCKPGVWPRDSQVGAVLRFQRIDLWNLWHNPSACLYINPYNINAVLPDALFRLPHAKGCDGEMKWFEGEDIAQLVE